MEGQDVQNVLEAGIRCFFMLSLLVGVSIMKVCQGSLSFTLNSIALWLGVLL